MRWIELLRMSGQIAANVLPAANAELPEILALLTAAGLPVADVSPATHPEFLVAREAGRVVGVVGLERFGDCGLLRSLAVRTGHQRQGLGLALTQALEGHALASGIGSLVLLTETAPDFFRKHGYRVITRAQAPLPVQASSEFRTLCPDSAVCMTKQL
jgi:amino-acid N-acetyltransferase